MRVVLLDNHDSFVYNLVDLFGGLGAEMAVYRNTTPVQDVLAALDVPAGADDTGARPMLCISPGPKHPRDAGCLMDITRLALERKIPLLGICLGFQGLVEAAEGTIDRVGPVHGTASTVVITPEGATDPAFAPFASTGLKVARYHSLGTRTLPASLLPLAITDDGIVMAAKHRDAPAMGLQFHPESILTLQGPSLLAAVVSALTTPTV